MFSRVSRSSFALTLACTIALGASVGYAGDPAKMANKLFENDRVKVVEVTIQAGEKMDSHSHPDHVIFFATDATLKETLADGKTSEINGKAGTAAFKKAVTHTTENVGKATARAIVAELKEPASTPSAATPADKDPVKLAADTVKVLFENDRIRVLQSKMKPGAKIAMHSHPAGVSYMVTDTMAEFTMGDGTKQTKDGKAGTATWHDAYSHAVENKGKAEATVVEFELKEPAKK